MLEVGRENPTSRQYLSCNFKSEVQCSSCRRTSSNEREHDAVDGHCVNQHLRILNPCGTSGENARPHHHQPIIAIVHKPSSLCLQCCGFFVMHSSDATSLTRTLLPSRWAQKTRLSMRESKMRTCCWVCLEAYSLRGFQVGCEDRRNALNQDGFHSIYLHMHTWCLRRRSSTGTRAANLIRDPLDR